MVGRESGARQAASSSAPFRTNLSERVKDRLRGFDLTTKK
jgi:hypothetical protein